VVIPAALRRKHRLTRGARLRIEEDGGRIVLEPLGSQAAVEERGGVLVVDAHPIDPDVDHRTVREEHLDRLGR
jgi:bifunctional DNA-binding transcriptional regulator/antitoxin component of YhaV-PrlF toxin-antitoxin module